MARSKKSKTWSVADRVEIAWSLWDKLWPIASGIVVSIVPAVAAWIWVGLKTMWPHGLLFIIPITSLGVALFVVGLVRVFFPRTVPTVDQQQLKGESDRGDPPPEGGEEGESREDQWRRHAEWWEFRLLQHRLVDATRYTLWWLHNNGGHTARSLYDSDLGIVGIDKSERDARLRALEEHHLIHVGEEMIDVTNKGRRYLNWVQPGSGN